MNPAGENTGTGKNSLFPFGVCAWRDHFSPSCLSGLEYLGDAFPLALPFILPFIIILSLFKSVLVYRYVFREDSVTALSLPGFRNMLRSAHAIRAAVSPFAGGKAISGPAGEMMHARGYRGSSSGLALFYRGLIDLLIIDRSDEQEIDAIRQTGIEAVPADTIVSTAEEKRQLAKQVLDATRRIG